VSSVPGEACNVERELAVAVWGGVEDGSARTAEEELEGGLETFESWGLAAGRSSPVENEWAEKACA
jgi:hypothetical protein